jgi:hypothetical protein
LEEEYDEYFRNNVSKSLSDYRAGKNPTTFHKQAMHSIRKKVLSSSGMYLSSHEIPHKNPLVELLGIA